MFKKQRIVLRQRWGQAQAQARADGELRASLPNQGMHVSVPTAYLWFAFSGMLGGHRIYMGRKWGWVLLYAVTLAYAGLGWVYDLFMIPTQVRELNAQIDAAIATRKAERGSTRPT